MQDSLHNTTGDRGAAVQEEYARLASDYDRRWASYIAATVRETMRRLDLSSTKRLLDIGCGTGVLLAEAASLAPGIIAVGVDICPEMLGVARLRCHTGISLVVADVERLPFPSASFDTVVSSSSFHYWSDPAKGLDEIFRLLRPGGRLVITDWCDDYIACKVCNVVLRCLNREHKKSYSLQQFRRFLRVAGYKVEVVECYKVSWLWGLMTARAVRPIV